MINKLSVAANRGQLLKRFFPDGVRPLWCPLLTHYDGRGAIDSLRISAHLRHLAPHVKSFLIPGSTGDGWEMSDGETRQLLEIALHQAQKLNLYLLIGALKADSREALNVVLETVDWIKSCATARETEAALLKARVCGFTVCAPHGKELAQEEIEVALSGVLETGLPTAIYQLPQVTQNEIGAALAVRLAMRFENFILFKDSSGHDRVALSGKSLEGVFTLRGAEGDYARWLRTGGGPYDGFLLSTANCFAQELRQIIADVPAGRLDAARRMSERLTAIVNEVFRLVAGLKDGNAFTNANKAIDHFFAHGPRAADTPPPRLHAGSCLPVEVIRATGEILSRHEMMPRDGYLD